MRSRLEGNAPTAISALPTELIIDFFAYMIGREAVALVNGILEPSRRPLMVFKSAVSLTHFRLIFCCACFQFRSI